MFNFSIRTFLISSIPCELSSSSSSSFFFLLLLLGLDSDLLLLSVLLLTPPYGDPVSFSYCPFKSSNCAITGSNVAFSTFAAFKSRTLSPIFCISDDKSSILLPVVDNNLKPDLYYINKQKNKF